MTIDSNQISAILNNFYAKQAHLIDAGQHMAWARTFTQDGEFHSPTYGSPAIGHASLSEISKKFQEGAKRAGEMQRHIVQNIWIEQSDPSLALVRCYLMIVATKAEVAEVRILRVVTIADKFERENDEWLISRRDVLY